MVSTSTKEIIFPVQFSSFRLTDAINETKDKVKYLDSIRRYFDQLNDGYSPMHIANVTIPAITSAVRQMDNISKFYARTGYLGVIFAKVIDYSMKSCWKF